MIQIKIQDSFFLRPFKDTIKAATEQIAAQIDNIILTVLPDNTPTDNMSAETASRVVTRFDFFIVFSILKTGGTEGLFPAPFPVRITASVCACWACVERFSFCLLW